jgi:hypothetical protein
MKKLSIVVLFSILSLIGFFTKNLFAREPISTTISRSEPYYSPPAPAPKPYVPPKKPRSPHDPAPTTPTTTPTTTSKSTTTTKVDNCRSKKSCQNNYIGTYDRSVNDCICVYNGPTLPSSKTEGCLIPCGDVCCPSGFCGNTNDGGKACFTGGGVAGNSSTSDNTARVILCAEPNTDCDPTDYCESNGFTKEKTEYLLEDVVVCTARINCEDVVRKGDCYEDSGSNPDDDLNLRVKIMEQISNWIKQTRLQLIEKI